MEGNNPMIEKAIPKTSRKLAKFSDNATKNQLLLEG